MRSFLTRLVSTVTRSLLLAPCLLICLACATPFPIESLEEGMSDGTVGESFGAPEAIKTKPGDVESSWTYPHEEQDWPLTVLSSTVFLPHCIILTAVTMPFGEEHWCSAVIPTVGEGTVVLHFEAEKLVRWEVIEPVPVVYSGSTYHDPFPSTMTFSTKDSRHHAKGHKHHHGH